MTYFIETKINIILFARTKNIFKQKEEKKKGQLVNVDDLFICCLMIFVHLYGLLFGIGPQSEFFLLNKKLCENYITKGKF